jgi:hypothetical protein
MPPKSKPAKKSPPSKASKAKSPAAAPREPEELNDRTVAGDVQAATAAATPIKTERSLDILAEYLSQQSEPLVPVRDAMVAAYGGKCDPDRELATLRIVKDDDRFVIERSHPGINRIGLVNMVAEISTRTLIKRLPGTTTETSNAAAPAKTLGEHVATAKASAQHIPWKHGIGSSVMLLTEGQPPKRATIRNIQSHGAFGLYDLNLGGAGGTIDGVPANRIGRDLDAEGELADLRIENAALRRHADKGAEIAQKHIQMAAVERQMAEVLKKHREAMEAVASQLEEHARSEPGQQDLRDVVGDGTPAKPAPGPSRGEKLKAPPKASEDKLAAAGDPPTPPAARGVIELDATGVTMDQLQAAAVNQATASTGKPQQVKPVKPKGLGAHVLGHVQDGVAVLLPLYSKDEWAKGWQALYGVPLDLPTVNTPERLAKGGKLNGTPVRVGRATLYVGAEKNALLVRLPPLQLAPEPETKAVGKEAAAGAD